MFTNRGLIPDEIVIEKENVTVFDGSNGNPVMNILENFSENYEGDERTYIDKDGDEIVNSYRLLLVAHNSSSFDSLVVLNSLVKEITDLKIIKTAKGLILISLSFRYGVKLVNTVELHQYVKLTCSKYHLKRSLEGIGKKHGLQPELLKGDIEHPVKKSNFADLKHVWEPYLRLEGFCLAFIYARHSMKRQKMSSFAFKDCLTEASLGWKCFGHIIKIENFTLLAISMLEILYVNLSKEEE